MPKATFSKGQSVRIGKNEYVIVQRLPADKWQLQNTETGEWLIVPLNDLLEKFASGELSFCGLYDSYAVTEKLKQKLSRDLANYPSGLVDLAQRRLQYLKELDRRQPIPLTKNALSPFIKCVAQQIKDPDPPGWCTVYRDYSKWRASGRDIRAILFNYGGRGNRKARMLPEVTKVIDQVINELYMRPERKRAPEVHLEVIRRLAEENKFRPDADKLPFPSRSAIYRTIAKKQPYEVMEARYGKRRAEIEFRTAGAGPATRRPLERVVMDHTPADMVVVDDRTMLPLGRPTITTALDEHTRCLLGFYAGFEPPSVLAVMRCLKHAITPKTYISHEFPCIGNSWNCYGVPEIVVVDNPPEFHSSHFERACLQIGCDIQYAKVLVPWYKGKIERFQGTMNRDLMHGQPGTTFSGILERDEYDPGKNAVVLLSTFREILHTWVVDVYLQTPHRGIKDTPAHKWHSESSDLPPLLPPSARELDLALGMVAHRVAFHYGIELEGLRYNSPELGELRRRIGPSVRVELTFDPGNLGQVNVLNPITGTYLQVPAIDTEYADGLSLWQNRVIRRYAQQRLNGRTDIVALANAKAAIRALVERDLSRKSKRLHKRQARFLEGSVQTVASSYAQQGKPASRNLHALSADIRDEVLNTPTVPSPELIINAKLGTDFSSDVTTDELPVFDADLSLPQSRTAETNITSDPKEREHE